jgi:acyl carrier protein
MASSSSAAPDSLEQRLALLIGERILDASAGLTPDTNLYDAGLDSLAIMQLLLLLEEEFQVVIPVESVSRANFSSIRSVADLLREKSDAPAAEPAIVVERLETSKVAVASPATPLPPQEATAPGGLLARMRGCDYFTLCFDSWSRKTGQGGHKAHSFLILDGIPDIAKLRALLDEAPRRFPMLFARLKRQWFVGSLDWLMADATQPVELRLVTETPGVSALPGAESCADAWKIAEEVVNTPLPSPKLSGAPKARFTVIELRDGGAMLIFSWSHLLMDGVGAEFFLRELARLAGDFEGESVPALQKPAGEFGWQECLARAKPMVQYFNRLVERTFDCLGPRKPRAGHTHFEVHTLTVEQTRRVNDRCVSLCGELVMMPFFLACAARAHERLFSARGLSPSSQVCSVPVQTRRKGARGPIFQNHITMFFGVLAREELTTLDGAVSTLMAQHSAFLKNRLGDALDGLMQMMSVMPPGLYMKFIMMQMRGPFASFFHSHTGEFAPGLQRFFGANIDNAFHVPGIATPPGTGIFCNEKNGRIVITLSWHENALDEAERRLVLDHLLADFGLG